MAFTAYERSGSINQNTGALVVFYEEAGLSTLAFATDAIWTDPFQAGVQNCLFDVAVIFTNCDNGVTYYASGGTELTPAAGSPVYAIVADVDDAGILDIGSYVSGDGSNCYYTTGAGLHTPSLPGYTFAPISDTATGIGVLGFTASAAPLPAKATNPNPANSATGVRLNQPNLTWTKGVGADTENVYFGPTGNMSLVESGDTNQIFGLSSFLPLSYSTGYQWRIDSVNTNGTTTGDTWSFTTLDFNTVDPATFQIFKRLVACANGKFWFEDI